MLDLNALNVFLVVAEYGSFSEAGRQLHLSQPAISQTIDNLEKYLGTSLFVRQGRSIRLTEAGQVLRPAAKELITAAFRIESTLASLEGEIKGEMTLGCSTTSGKYLLPSLIAAFRRRYPLVRVNVLVGSRDSVVHRLLAGEYDLGVSSKKVDHRDLEYQEFFKDDVVLIVPIDHPWARFGRIYPDDLLDEPMILREDGAGTLEVLSEGLRGQDISLDMLNVVMTLGNAEAITMAVEEGIGVAFVSRLAAARSKAMGRVAYIEVQGMPLYRQIFMMRSRRFPVTRAQAELWRFVQYATQIVQDSLMQFPSSLFEEGN